MYDILPYNFGEMSILLVNLEVYGIVLHALCLCVYVLIKLSLFVFLHCFQIDSLRSVRFAYSQHSRAEIYHYGDFACQLDAEQRQNKNRFD